MNGFFFFLMVLSVLLETSAIPVPLTTGLVTALSLVLGFQAAGIIFISGLLFDLFTLRPLGASAMYFLLICFLAGRYQRKIFSGNTFYTVLLLLASIAGYQMVFFRRVDVYGLVISVTLALAFLVVVNRFLPHDTKLKVA